MNIRLSPYLIVIAIIGILVVPILSAHASDGGGSKALVQKEYTLDTIARTFARNMLNKMLAQVSKNLATLGPGGSPAWIENWRRFFRNSQDLGRDIFAWQIYDAALGERATICKFLADPIAEMFNATYNPDNRNRSNEMFRYDSAQPFNRRARCTLPDDFDPNKYYNDWNFDGVTFHKMSQSGDFYNLIAQALEEQQTQINAEFDTTKTQGIANLGFKSIYKKGRIVTPGKVLSDVQAKTMTAEIDWLISADELQEVISAGIGLVVNRLYDYTEASLLENLDPTDPAYPIQPTSEPIDRSTCQKLCAQYAKSYCDVDQPTICSTSSSTTNSDTGSTTSGTQTCTVVTESECRISELTQCKTKYGCI